MTRCWETQLQQALNFCHAPFLPLRRESVVQLLALQTHPGSPSEAGREQKALHILRAPDPLSYMGITCPVESPQITGLTMNSSWTLTSDSGHVSIISVLSPSESDLLSLLRIQLSSWQNCPVLLSTKPYTVFPVPTEPPWGLTATLKTMVSEKEPLTSPQWS
jgi:hypothetical protein